MNRDVAETPYESMTEYQGAGWRFIQVEGLSLCVHFFIGKLSIITKLGQEKDNSINNCLWFNSLGIYYQPSDRTFPM